MELKNAHACFGGAQRYYEHHSSEIGLAMNLEATWDEVEATIHAHPTLSEMVKEATEVAKGHPIHV